MPERQFVFDPRMLITGPFRPCPNCEHPQLGTLSVSDNVHTCRCRNCFHTESERLPPLEKKMIYLDQMVISGIAKELDPVWKKKTRRRDGFWVEAFDRLHRLVKLQLIVCPSSPIHKVESSYAERYEPVLRHLYEHLASGVRLRFPHQVYMEQLWEAFDAWCTGRDPDWGRITRDKVIRGDLDRWSDRLRITVDMGRSPGQVASRRKSRDRAHVGFREFWDRCASQGPVPFDDRFREERRGVATAALGPHRKPLWLVRLMRWLEGCLKERGVSDATKRDEAERFLQSEAALSAPENHLGALLFAALGRRAASGQKRVPSRGTPNDIKFISAYLPYCDAMFIDNEFAQLLSEQPVASEVEDYPTRIFSTRSRDDFLAYLATLEDDPTHVERVVRTYGETWIEPYRTMLEHERSRRAASAWRRRLGSPEREPAELDSARTKLPLRM